MATTITDNFGKITFVISATTYSVDKSDILSMKQNHEQSRIEVKVARGNIDGNVLHIVFSDVTSPADKSISLLYKTIRDYWREPTKNYCLFMSDAAQTVFDVTPRLKLNDNSHILVDQQMQTYGWSRSGNKIIFSVAMTGGEEIVVFQ